MIEQMAHPEAPALDARTAATTASARVRRPAPPAARFAAAASDALWLAGGSVGASVLALVFLFWRTSWGAVDAGTVDTAIAAALVLAPAPAWLAWMLVAAIADEATPGQERRRLVVLLHANAWPGARALRFALHPASTAGWLWLAVITFLLKAPWLGWLLVVAAIVVTLGGVGSAILIILGRRALHDLFARTRVESRA